MARLIDRHAADILNYVKKQGTMEVTVVSAVPLDEEQKASIKNKLAETFKKQIRMAVKIDPAILGGIRIIAGHIVIDNTIKKKLFEMKKNIYKGVYFK